MEPIGKIAYEAYRQYLASNTEGPEETAHWLSHSEWEELDPVQREAWQAAADAVAELYA
jgi:hypothetical protein